LKDTAAVREWDFGVWLVYSRPSMTATRTHHRHAAAYRGHQLRPSTAPACAGAALRRVGGRMASIWY
jgi:hypothetical protein